MAVDEGRRRDDLYAVKLRPHDQRVELNGWTYYVRGVKQESELVPRVDVVGEPLIDVPLLAARGIRRLVKRRVGWIVAVVRLGSVKTWNDVTPEVVHSEVLPTEQDPEPRIAELVDEVESGRYAPDQ